MPEQTGHRELLDLEAIRAELRNVAHLEKAAQSSTGALVNQRATMAWVSLGRHVPRLVETVELLVRQHARLEHKYEDRRDELERERGSATAVARVRALHQQYRTAWTDQFDVCSHCTRGMELVRWPCDTIRALDGEPVDRAAAGSGVGNPATEHQPLPTPAEFGGSMIKITTTRRTADDHHDVWFGDDRIGAVRPTDVGWLALPGTGPATLRPCERDAVYAVVHVHTGGGYITTPLEVPDAG